MPPTEQQSRLLVLSDVVYRRLLVLYPKAFRAAYGGEMAQVFRDRARQAYRTHRAIGVLALWPATLRDLVASAAAEQARQERHVSRKTVVLAIVLVLVIGGGYLRLTAPFIFYRILASILWRLDPLYRVLDLLAIQPVFNLLFAVYSIVRQDLPLALVLVTVAFQLCLLPLARRQVRAARALRTLQPQLAQLRQQYRTEPHALRAAQRDLYRMHGIKPASIRRRLLVQVAFLFVLSYALAHFDGLYFRALSLALEELNSYLYPFVPRPTTLQQPAHFLWLQGAYSLSTPDPWHVLPVLAAVLTAIVVSLMRRRDPTVDHAAPRRPLAYLATGVEPSVIVVLTLLIGLVFPAGIALSWSVSMLFMAVQDIILSRHVAWTSDPAPRR
jgi:YidC/Oxa1 family membrane protein insertase